MARLDTGWHANPKVLALGLQAMGLHAWSISYCDYVRSDGFIPAGAWPALPGVRQALKQLVDAGVWEMRPDGYQLHDYLQYNRSKEQIEAELADNRVRKRSARNPEHVRPDTARNQNGGGPESGRNPRAPGPGPLSTGLLDAAAAAETPVARARARGDGGFRPLSMLLDGPAAAAAASSNDLPDEVRDRLARPPIETTTSHADH